MMATTPPHNAVVSRTASAGAGDRRGSDSSSRWDNTYGQNVVNLDDPMLDEDELPRSPRSSSGRGLTSYPGTDEDDRIIWSGWDSIGTGSISTSVFLSWFPFQLTLH